MINGKTIIDEVKKRFSLFEIPEEAEGLPTVVFSFLTIFMIRSIQKKEDQRISSFISFINDLAKSNDSTVIACLSEIFLGLYNSRDIDFREIKSRLSAKGNESFQQTIDLWDSQKNIK